MIHPLPFSDQRFDRSDLERVQLEQLNALIARARAQSPFHRARLPEAPLSSLDELALLPFMDADSLRSHADMLLVPPQHVARMVSLPTSGTSGEAKRIAFSGEDTAQTREFFASGLHCIARAGERTAVLFPSSTPGGMGSLICSALGDIDAVPAPVDIAQPLEAIARDLAVSGATSAVGSGHTLLALARFAQEGASGLSLERVLISSDNASRSMVASIERGLHCEAFEHYGMTETGFGCAVDCHAHAGMHVREFDLLVEIVDPQTGAVLPVGSRGEVVVTTLRREAMPVIRYRTGDISRIVPGTCPCGGSLRRLDRVRGHALARDDGSWRLEERLDEAVFALPGVLDYEARRMESGRVAVTLHAFGDTGGPHELPESLHADVTVEPFDARARLGNPKASRLA